MRSEYQFIAIEAALFGKRKKKKRKSSGLVRIPFRRERRQRRAPVVGDRRNFGRTKCQPISHLRQAVSYYRVEV